MLGKAGRITDRSSLSLRYMEEISVAWPCKSSLRASLRIESACAMAELSVIPMDFSFKVRVVVVGRG